MLAAVIVLAAGILAYGNSFSGPFVFDGTENIQQNPAIRKLWPPWAPMVGTNRPLGFWSFALNYALGGTKVWGYHAANLAIHLAAAMVLFGIVRRTLSRGPLALRFAAAAYGLALAVALLWLLQPLQTQSVTYIYQRFESLMGLLVLLTLYSFVRAQDSSRPKGWYAAAVACCLLAVATKEVAATAPLLILWYDRAFVAASWREIIRRRWALYSGLAGTWAVLAAIMLGQAGKYPKAGVLAVENVSPLQYAFSQPGVIAHYLRLCFWPTGLCLDYGWPVADTAVKIVPPLLLIVALLAVTAWSIFRWPEWSFVGAWFFLILAPTSSVFPIKDLAFEHRMYLPLAAVATGVVVGGWVAGQWLVRRGIIGLPVLQAGGGLLVMFASIAFGFLTFQRNVDYQSELSIWEDTVVKSPNNARVHNNLGKALATRGQIDEAMAHYRTALEINPDYPDAHSNLGAALARRGQTAEAMAHYRKALEINPDYAEAHNNLGVALNDRGQVDEAIAHYRKALEVKPDYAEVHNNLGFALRNKGVDAEAIVHFRKALELNPEYAEAHNNLGITLAGQGRMDEAIVHLRSATELNARVVAYHCNLANALAQLGQFDEMMAEYRETLEIDPNFPDAHNNLGVALVNWGQFDEAIAHFQKALESKPDYPNGRNNLNLARSRLEELLKTLAGQRELLRSRPNDLALLNDIAWLLATNPNRMIRNGAEAVELAQRAEQLSDGRAPAILGTLAAAYAEAGRFPEAVQTAHKALELATQQNNPSLAESIKAKIPLYEAGTPFRAMPQPPAAGSVRP